MPIVRKLLTLLAMLAFAAAAGAPSALAQFPHNQTPRLIVKQEIHATSDMNCPAVTPNPAPDPLPVVTTGGCRVHIVSSPPSTLILSLHTMAGAESVIANCVFEASMRIDVDGEGYLSHQELTGAGCMARACGQVNPPTGEGRAWPFYMREGDTAPKENVFVLLCTETLAGANPVTCEFTIPLSQPLIHRYRIQASHAAEHAPMLTTCKISGNFTTEAGGPLSGEAQAYQNVEIQHN
jgi:hypothetical protein